MQLQIDPTIDAHCHDLLHIAGAGAKGEAIERLHGALVLVRNGIASRDFFPGEQLRNCAD
jgi:hypothetical protein